MIIKSIKDKIKEYFLLNPTEKLRVRQIERIVKVPFPSVVRYTTELVEEKILQTNKIANIKVFSANRTSPQFIINKKLYNQGSIFSSNLINFLIHAHSNPTVVLFGSYSKGEDTEDSDIDIYIETHSRRTIKLDNFEKKLHRSIQVFQYKQLSDIKNSELANNIINGITLNGFLEVFK